MAKYKVTCIHHRKAYRKGDLEAEDVIESVDIFNTRRDVNLFLEGKAKLNRSRGFRVKLYTPTRVLMPELSIHIDNNKWIHENTGSEHHEYYWFRTENI